MSKRRLALFVFVVLIGVACLFHRPLLLNTCRLILSLKLKGGCYENLAWQEDKLVLTHLLVKNPEMELAVDRISVKVAFDYKTLTVHPYIEILHPQVAFYDHSSAGSASLPFLYRSSWVKPHLVITDAVFELDSTRLYGSFTQKEGCLGQLLLASDPNLEQLPLMRVDVKEQDDDFAFEFEIHEQEISSSLSLCRHLFSLPLLDRLSLTGQVQGEGHCVISSSYAIKEMAVQIGLAHIDASFSSVSLTGLQGGLELLLLPENDILSLQSACTATLIHGEDNIPLAASFQGELLKQEQFFLKGELVTQGKTTFDCRGTLSQGAELTLVGKGWQKEECDLCLPQVVCSEGRLDFEATLAFSLDSWTSLQLRHVQGKDLRLYPMYAGIYQDKHAFFTKELFLEAELSPVGVSSLQLEVKGGEYLSSDVQLYAIDGKVEIADFSLQPSSLQWEWDYSPFNLTYQGEQNWELAGAVDIKNLCNSWGGQAGSLPCEFVMKGCWQEGVFSSHVVATLFTDEVQGEILWNIPSFTVLDLIQGNLPALSLQKGVARGSIASLASYAKLLPMLKAEGELHVDALFNASSLSLQVGGQDLAFTWDGHTCFIPSLVKEKTRLLYEEGILSVSLPIEKMKMHDREMSCHFNGSYDLHEGIAEGKLSSLVCSVNALTEITEATVEWSASASRLQIHMAEGKWADWYWKLRPLTLLRDKPFDFSFSLFSGRKEIALVEGGFDPTLRKISFNPKTTRLLSTALNIEPFTLDLSVFEMRPTIRFDELPELLKVVEQSGFFSSSLPYDKWKGQGKADVRILFANDSGEWKVALVSSDAKWQGHPHHPLRVEARYLNSQWVIEKLQAGPLSLKATVQSFEDGIRFSSVEGKQNKLFFKANAYLRPKEDTLTCSFESIRYEVQEDGMQAQVASSLQCTAFLERGEVTGQAHLLMQLKEPFVCNFANEKVLSFTYSDKEGLKVLSPRFSCTAPHNGAYLATLSSAQVLMPKFGFFSCTGVEIRATRLLAEQIKDFPPFTWEKEVVLSGDLQVKPTSYAFQGELAAGRYGYKEHAMPFEQIQCFADPSTLHVRFKTALEEQPLWGTLQLKRGKETFGTLQLFDHPKAKGLQLTFRTSPTKTQVEAIEGSCYGVESHLSLCSRRRAQGITPLSGSISFDFLQLVPLLPKGTQQKLSALKLGSGYKWTGDLFLLVDHLEKSTFYGTLQGRDFSLLGYRFAKMDATLSGSFQNIQLDKLRLEESLATIEIPTCKMVKQQADYAMQIPTVYVRSLQPSALRKITEGESSLKPFIIEECTLSGFSGRLSEVGTWQAEGKLAFTNQFKKEASFFDFPLEMIKKMGLDLGVLTPVEGEVSLELRGDKFYLISLDHAYSDQQRSSFYLTSSSEPSYIDFNGNVHIDLKMHQDTLFKVIEPFTLTVRGTLDKPRYGLQF